MIEGKNPNGATTKISYDSILRYSTQVTDPLGNVTGYQYDPLGHLLQTSQAIGSKVTNDYDAIEQKVAVANALGEKTNISYDKKGNMEKFSTWDFNILKPNK